MLSNMSVPYAAILPNCCSNSLHRVFSVKVDLKSQLDLIFNKVYFHLNYGIRLE